MEKFKNSFIKVCGEIECDDIVSRDQVARFLKKKCGDEDLSDEFIDELMRLADVNDNG